MNVNSVGSNPSVLAAQTAKQTFQVKAASSEAKESAAAEASESRAVQILEGEIGRSVNTYA